MMKKIMGNKQTIVRTLEKGRISGKILNLNRVRTSTCTVAVSVTTFSIAWEISTLYILFLSSDSGFILNFFLTFLVFLL